LNWPALSRPSAVSSGPNGKRVGPGGWVRAVWGSCAGGGALRIASAGFSRGWHRPGVIRLRAGEFAAPPMAESARHVCPGGGEGIESVAAKSLFSNQPRWFCGGVAMKYFVLVLALLGLTFGASQASAQQSYLQNLTSTWKTRNTASGFTSGYIKNQTVNRAVPQYSFSNVNRGLLSNVTGARPMQQKPFSSYNRTSGVTPYMGLLASNPFTSTTDNYFSIVRPQLEQQKINEQMERRNMMLQKQLNDIASQGPYNPEGAENRAPTGHVAVYMNYGGYYTPVQPKSVRPQRR
jgi:hypothetical protein